jgi:TRAP-type transport system periplasmic protein
MKRILLLILLLGGVLSCANGQIVMRISSPWPAGSDIMKLVAAAGETIKSKTGGKVTLSVSYQLSAGISEGTMVNDLTRGVFDAAFITADGLISIDKEFTVLDLPFLITTENELARVQTQLASDLSAILEKAGFYLGCWANPGPGYIFTKPTLAVPDDLKNVRFAVLTYDVSGMTFLARIPSPCRPMGITEIKPSLSNGAVTGYLGTCFNSVRYEWNMKVRYMIDLPVRFGAGAIIIRKAFLDGLSEDQRKIVTGTFKSLEREVNSSLADINTSSRKNLTRLTIMPVAFPEGTGKALLAIAEPGWREKAGTLYSTSMLQKVRTILGK